MTLYFMQVLHNHTIVYDIQYVPQEDSFRTTKKVTKMIFYDSLEIKSLYTFGKLVSHFIENL